MKGFKKFVCQYNSRPFLCLAETGNSFDALDLSTGRFTMLPSSKVSFNRELVKLNPNGETCFFAINDEAYLGLFFVSPMGSGQFLRLNPTGNPEPTIQDVDQEDLFLIRFPFNYFLRC